MLPIAALGCPAAARTLNPAAPAVSHLRVVPLSGGQNFRDLGGYRAAGGRHVKWGLLYRSGAMTKLTDTDFAELRRRNIRTIVDFRSTDERVQQPTPWPTSFSPAVLHTDYTLHSGGLFKALSNPDITAPQARAAFQDFYSELPFQFADQYHAMFAQLLAGKTPLVFNCSAGKDRTGVAAALLLSALGVPRRTIVEDYLLSNRNFDPSKTLATDAKGDGQWRRLPPDVMQVMMGVDASYLDAAFAAIDRHPGGMQNYMRDRLGLAHADIARLRALYLEKP